MTTIHAQLTLSLLQRYSLPVSPTWLTTFLNTTRQPHPPLPALTSTAHFRILASDITTSLSPTSPNTTFPSNLSSTGIKELRLPHSIPCQVLDIQDLGSSKWSQVEAIERVERGEEVRGREVIRTVPGITDEDDPQRQQNPTPAATGASTNQAGAAAAPTPKRSLGPHKLILQDSKGNKAVAFELSPIPRLWISNSVGEGADVGMAIGCKLVLQAGTVVRRGMVMLEARNVKVLGGKIESWDRKWREGRKGVLLEEVNAKGDA